MREKEIRPSKASVWIRCPASVTAPVLCSGEEDGSALDGRLAHWLAERLFTNEEEPKEGSYRENEDGSFSEDPEGGATIGSSMVSAIFDYVDYLKSLSGHGAIEKKLEFLPGRFGTADFISIGGDFRAHIVDFKTGFKFVNARENFQLMSYLCAVPDIADDDRFRITIFQPRAYGYPVIRDYDLDGIELKRFRTRLAEAAVLAEQGTSRPSPHPEACVSCEAISGCRALSAKLAEIREASFSHDPARVAALLDWWPAVKKLFESLEKVAYELLLDGKEVPGYTIECRRGSSRFVDGVTDEDILNFAKDNGICLSLDDIRKTETTVERISPAGLSDMIKGKGSYAKKKDMSKLTYYSPGTPVVKKTIEVFHEAIDESELF